MKFTDTANYMNATVRAEFEPVRIEQYRKAMYAMYIEVRYSKTGNDPWRLGSIELRGVGEKGDGTPARTQHTAHYFSGNDDAPEWAKQFAMENLPQ